MRFFKILSFFFFSFSIFLIIQIFKRAFFFIYLIQLKEYRIDRIKAYFRTITGKQQLINSFNFLKWTRFYHPKFTLRAILICIIVFFLQYNLFFVFLRLFYSELFNDNLLLLLLFNLILFFYLTPIFVFIVSLIFHLFLLPIKEAIFYLATQKRKKMKNLLSIGITGSYGKTAHKEIISFLLAKDFKVIKTPLNCNTRLGIALLILNKLKIEHNIFVVEMGAYRKGEIRDICKMVKPRIGILTGINNQHFELFGSLRNIMSAKYELIDSLPKNGLAIFNANNKYTLKLAKKTKLIKKIYGKEKIFYRTGLLADWYQEAIKAGLELGKYLGLSKRKMIKRLSKFKDFPLAIKTKKGKNGVLVIDDSGNTNPSGFLAALALIKKIKKRKKILITPGIIELGKTSNKIHQRIGRKAVLACQRIILTKKDFYQAILKGIKEIRPNFILEIEENPDKLGEKISKDFRKGNLILLEGRVPVQLKKSLMIPA